MVVSSRRDLAPRALAGAGVAAAAALGWAGATASPLLLATVVGGAVAAGAVAAPWLGVLALLLLSSTDGFLKHLAPTPAAYVLKDGLLLLVLIGVAVRLAIQPGARVAGAWRGGLAVAVFVGVVLSQAIHPAGSFAGGLAALRAHALFAALFVVGGVLLARRDRFVATANAAIVVGAVCALGALAQHALGSTWNGLGPGFAKAAAHYTSFVPDATRGGTATAVSYRMYGTLVDPAALGLACAYGMLAALAALPRLRGLARLAAVAALPLMGIALLESQTRSAAAGLAAGLLVVALLALGRRETRRGALAGLVLVGLAVPAGIALTQGAVLQRFASHDAVAYAAATRDRSTERTLDELAAFPFGHGLGATGAGGDLRAEGGFAVDNTYFSTLYETGIPGLAALLLLQGAFLALGLRAALRAQNLGARTAYAGIVAGQVALLVAGWFTQGAFDYAPLAQQFWLFCGAVARQDALAPAEAAA